MSEEPRDTQALQAELMSSIMEQHAREPHKGFSPARARVHVAIHTVVETQLKEGDPAETGLTLRRLRTEGMTRHEAIHLIGDVVSEVVMGHMGRGEGFDAQEFTQRLKNLNSPPQDD